MANERVRQAVAYLEGGNADLAPMRQMGLTAADLDEVLELVAWGDRAPLAVKETVERLYEARVAEEEQAGLAMPLVVVKERRKGRLRRLGIVLVAIGVLFWVVSTWRARRPVTADKSGAPNGASEGHAPGSPSIRESPPPKD